MRKKKKKLKKCEANRSGKLLGLYVVYVTTAVSPKRVKKCFNPRLYWMQIPCRVDEKITNKYLQLCTKLYKRSKKKNVIFVKVDNT